MAARSAKAKDGEPKKERAKQRKRTPRPAAGTKAAKKVNAAAKAAPKGRGLTVAQRKLRDTVMLQRIAQGWGLAAIAAEMNIDQDTARNAIERARKENPLVLSIEPTEIVESVLLGLQLSIGDFEAMGLAALQANNIAAAVGAKKGANDARMNVIQLLQDVGKLPEDLGGLRDLLDLKRIAEAMVAAVDGFIESVEDLDLPKPKRAQVLQNAEAVRRTFESFARPAGQPSQELVA